MLARVKCPRLSVEGRTVQKVIVFFVSIIWAMAVVPAHGQLVPLCVYTTTQSTFQDLTLSGNYNYSKDQFKNRPALNSGSATLSFKHVSDAPSLGFLIDGSAKLSLENNVPTYEVNSRANMRSYWDQSDLFSDWGLEGETVPTAQGINWGARALVGLGYGRFKDVTPYSKALKIQTQLIEMKSLPKPLSPETIQSLTKLIVKRGEFPDVPTLVQKLAEVVEQSDPMQKKLGALELLRIEEIITGKDNKLCGWDVSVGAGYELLDPSGGPRDFFLHTSFNYALAPAPRSQFVSKVSFDSQLDFFDEHLLGAEANYSYRFSDRIDALVKYKFQSNKLRKSSAFETQSIFVGVTFQVQANLNFQVQLYLTHNSGYEEWAQQLIVTASYDFF